MPIEIQIYSDYVCPYCLLAKAPLGEAVAAARQDGREVEVEWMPFELRPYPEPTLLPEDPYLPRVWAQSVYPMARALGQQIHLPSISPQPYTRLAFEGYQFAREHGKGAQYNDRMLSAFFVEDLDIGQPDVLERLAEEVGLPHSEFRAALQDGRYAQAHQEALRLAYEKGVSSVPTFVIGEQMLRGVHSEGTLLQAIEDAAG